jgi:iron complex outermembrane recepter protein
MRIALRATALSSALAGLAFVNPVAAAVTTALGAASSAAIRLAQAEVPAAAQSAQTTGTSAEPRATGLEEIIVTATRRESLASETPIALTAISGEGLIDSGVTNPTELADVVPNLSIDRANGGVLVTIRGVTSNDTSEKGDPSAAFMLDGTYIARPQAQEVSFYDIARVEVLRGPQGTLYGRNTTAGLINVITNRPTFGEFSGSGNVAGGNFGAVQATGVLNAPLTDRFAIRAAVNYDQRDNYLDGGPLLTGDIDPFKENISGRLQGLYDWSSGNLLVAADYSEIKGSPYDLLPLRNFFAATTTGVNPQYIGDDRNSDELRYVNTPIAWDTFRENNTWGVGAELNQDIGPVTMTYTGSYREFTRDEGDARISVDGALAYRAAFAGDYDQTSHELRFANNGDGALQLQAGLYYFREESHILQRLMLVANPGPTGDGASLGFAQGPTIAESRAAFAQGTLALTDALRLTAGARYSEDEKSRVGFTLSCASFFNCGATPPTSTNPTNNAEADFSKTTWRVGLDYDITDGTMIYGSVATGYKAGGFNDGCVAGTAPGCTQPESLFYYDPEELTAYEVGAKTRLLDDSLSLNVAAFLYDYSNIQLSQLVAECFGPGSGPCSVTTNGGEAEVTGVEIEGIYALTSADRIDFSLAYLDAHFTDFRPNPTTDFNGKSLDRSPEWAATLGYQHTFSLGNGGEIVGGVRSRYSDSYTIMALGTLNFYEQPSYTKTDVTLTYNAPQDVWYLQAFARNLEDSIVVTTVAVGVRSSVQISDPFTYGLRAGFNF